ncbi:hypothetical protein [Sphingomonas sp.]|uniref:hypothetical protein n=1 Tax=Sphingomonas sp. TaxID=28214 RepID=UPI00286C08C3|nr:hypothetical protein [Sphingomonas sp.]
MIAALGLALAFIPLRRALIAAGVMVLVALAACWSSPPEQWIEPIFVGCWLSVIATAGLVHRPLKVPPALFLAAAANVGLWAGLVTSVAGQSRDLAIALPCVLLLFIGRPIVVRGWGIGVKVVASWLTAVAILATMVSLTPTPGYKQDHME